MKKLFVGLTVVLSLISFSSNAQQKGNDDRAAQRKEAMKQNLKDSVQLSDEKAGKIVDLRMEATPQMREIMSDQSITMDQKRAKMKEINDKMNEKIKTFLTSEEMTKYDAYMERNQKRMNDRGKEGGRPPREGGK